MDDASGGRGVRLALEQRLCTTQVVGMAAPVHTMTNALLVGAVGRKAWSEKAGQHMPDRRHD